MPIGARSAITGFVPGRRPGMGWAWLAAPLVAATGWLPTGFAWVAALAFVIVLGVPHGALDGEIGRAILRPRFGRAWFPMFAVPYLALFAGVLVAWRMAPVATLATFLAASVWHFGADEGGGGSRVQTIALGGLPIALPIVLHPAATMLVFSTIAMVPIDRVPAWLADASLAWVVVAAVWVGQRALRRESRLLLVPALLVVGFVALPPLTAFTLYFVCVHAPAHTRAVIADPHRAPRVHDLRSAVVLALPITGLTLLIGSLLWPLYEGPLPSRLLALTVQMLAALTLPHMLLDGWLVLRRRAATR